MRCENERRLTFPCCIFLQDLGPCTKLHALCFHIPFNVEQMKIAFIVVVHAHPGRFTDSNHPFRFDSAGQAWDSPDFKFTDSMLYEGVSLVG